MSLSNIFSVAGSAMNAQSQRLNTVASNLANADCATSADGTPYKAKQVVIAATPVGENGATGVNVAAVVEDQSPMKQVYDPMFLFVVVFGFVFLFFVFVVVVLVF